MSRLSRIVYCSRSLLKGSRTDIEVQIRRILATARTFNHKAGLTGALTFNENIFAQVLEGDLDNLEPLYQRIRRDPRHTDVKLLAQDNPKEKLFPIWSMAYVDTPSGHGRHPLAHFAFEAALTHGATPEAQLLLDALRRFVVARTERDADRTERQGGLRRTRRSASACHCEFRKVGAPPLADIRPGPPPAADRACPPASVAPPCPAKRADAGRIVMAVPHAPWPS